MTFRYCLTNIALGGWIAAAILAAVIVAQWNAAVEPRVPARDYDRRSALVGKSIQGTSEERLLHPRLYEPRCRAPESPEEADLCAQRAMADAADKMADLTWWQMVIGAGGFVALVITLAVSVIATIAATRATRVAERHLAASERPWISVGMSVGSSLTFSEAEGRITVAFVMKNVGNAPAVNVWVHPKFCITGTGLDEIENTAKREREKPARRLNLGHTLFPGEMLNYGYDLPINLAEIRNHFSRYPGAPEIRLVPVTLVGAVTYRSPIDNEMHHTGFVADLLKIDTTTGRPSLVPSIGDEIPENQLVLRRSFLSGNVS